MQSYRSHITLQTREPLPLQVPPRDTGRKALGSRGGLAWERRPHLKESKVHPRGVSEGIVVPVRSNESKRNA